MKRKLSMLLVMSLVLISIITACFMGCTKAPKALKGVDIKNADEVMDKIGDIIDDGNYTVEITQDTPAYNLHVEEKMEMTQDAFSYYAAEERDGQKGYSEKIVAQKTKTGSRIYSYNEVDKKWNHEDLDDKFSDGLKYYKSHNIYSQISHYDLEYNKTDKVLEGAVYIGPKEYEKKYDATIEIDKDSIIINLSRKTESGEEKITETYTKIGETKVSIPKE